MYLTLMAILAVAVPISLAVFLFQKHALTQKLIVSTLASFLGLGAVFGGFQIAWNHSYSDALSFTEYWNGYETGTDLREVTCRRDGSCVRTYDCDPYTILVTKTRSVSDGNGGTRTETYTETETRYHSCPYSTQETSYYLDTTLGKMTVASNVMTGEPFRSYVSIPGGQQTAPPEWVEAKARIEANTPNGVTKTNRYDNYILASENTILKEYSALVEDYLAEGILPAPAQTTGVYTSKVTVVDNAITAEQEEAYNVDLGRLNGIFGETRQGDLHLVFVPGNTSQDYLYAIQAYWLDKSYHERETIAKNTITIVLAVDNKDKITWAGGFTGMPYGNESLLQDITNLRGKTADDNLIGAPMADLNTYEVRYTDGLIERLILNDNGGFQRVSMGGDEEGNGGFKYLSSEVDVDISGMTYFFTALLTLLTLGGIGFLTYWYYSEHDTASRRR